jgi:dTDP-4-dehydrorhamnose 3,5-epimerase
LSLEDKHITKALKLDIQGIVFYPSSIISDDRGAVLHMLNKAHPLMGDFGEMYFSEIKSGITKGWKQHSKMTQRITVPVGLLQFVFYDDRKLSSTCGQTASIILGREQQYGILIIPPNIWYGFKNLSADTSLLANCADIPHDPTEQRTVPLQSETIPYVW